jgi:Mg-chelatase subunit ChlD
MSRERQRAIGTGLWLLLTALLVITAWLMLFACGVRILGFQLNFCPARSEIRVEGQQAEIAALMRRVQELERASAARPQCRADAPPESPRTVLGDAPRPAEPAITTPTRPPEACTQARETATTVVVLDGSRSMLLPYDIDPARDRELHEMLSQSGLSPEQQQEVGTRYEQAFGPPGQRRIDRAREAALEILNRPDTAVAAVTFEACEAIAGASGSAAAELVRKLTPRGGTPIAAALARATQQIAPGADGRRNGTIVLVTDGAESCHGDPCATARNIKRDNPGIVINVVDVAGWTDIACVARETGGIVRRGGGDIDLSPLVRIGATRQAANQCEGAIERTR